MRIAILLNALRAGTTFPHASRWKWAGAALVCGVVVFKSLQMCCDVGQDISDTDVIEFVTLILALYIQTAASKTLGLPSSQEPCDDSPSK